MNFYILTPVKDWEPWYDCCFGMVVRAEDEQQARKLASQHAAEEGDGAWLDDNQTNCQKLTANGSTEVILRDIHEA